MSGGGGQALVKKWGRVPDGGGIAQILPPPSPGKGTKGVPQFMSAFMQSKDYPN